VFIHNVDIVFTYICFALDNQGLMICTAYCNHTTVLLNWHYLRSHHGWCKHQLQAL